MGKKAVVFDLDGTLLNTLPDIAAAMNEALRANGLPEHPEQAYRLFTGDGAMNLSIRAAGEAGKDKVDAVYRLYAANYAANSRVKTAPYPGMAPALRQLHALGLRLCVLSNKDDADARQVVAHYFPDQQFAIVRGRMPGVPIKPDPAALFHMMEELGLTREELWYVGDTRTDMRCARAAGIERVGVLWGFQTREEIGEVGADHYVSTAHELVRLLGA